MRGHGSSKMHTLSKIHTTHSRCINGQYVNWSIDKVHPIERKSKGSRLVKGSAEALSIAYGI